MAAPVYGNRPETILRATPKRSGRPINHVLLGTYLEVLEERNNWLKVKTRNAGRGGWVHRNDVRDNPGLKIFYVDVGQGDGAIAEHPDGILMIDGGPTTKFHSFVKHRYRPLIQNWQKVHIDALVVSHPDADHYAGFTAILRDKNFTVESIFHNGIIRYDPKNLPADREFDLGKLREKTVNGRKEHVLIETFSTLKQAKALVESDVLLNSKGNETVFLKFWKAALMAADEGRLQSARRITIRDNTLPAHGSQDHGKIFVEVLGPVPTKMVGRVEYVAFPSTEHIQPKRGANDQPPEAHSSHTRNGHSIVLKIHFGVHSFLFGGDLNIPAQLHLIDHYGDNHPFQADVSKACHHGSSDFLVEFLKMVKPQANVVSSGDNKSFDHPVADAIGALARHTRGDFPLFFSTELARAVSKGKTHYGLINARSNGEVLTMAQMKEQHKRKADVWDSFTVPWRGRFRDVLTKHTSDTKRML